MLESEKYKLSTYQKLETLRETEDGAVELVECSLDGNKYIKKTYQDDKRAVYNKLSEIENEYIPKIYEVFFGEDTIIIERYIDGKTLEKMISEGHIFSRTEVEKIVKCLINAIKALHDNGIIYRDIKPGNIIVDTDDNAYLIDYGIARIFSQNRCEDTEHLGTVGFAAPEQFGFSQSDFRTDIYAFGVTVKQISAKSNLSAVMSQAMEKCTEFDPNRRFQSIDELNDFLNKGRQNRRIALVSCFSSLVILSCLCIFILNRGNNSRTSELTDVTTLTEISDLSETDETVTSIPEKISGTTVIEINETTGTDDVPESLTISTTASEETMINGNDNIDDNEEISQSDSPLIYDFSGERIVDVLGTSEKIPCLPLMGNNQNVTLSLGENMPDITLEANISGNTISLVINGTESFEFTDDSGLSAASYPNGKQVAEIIFYDMNGDGVSEIIPVLSNAVRTEWANGTVVLLRNYSLGWCIYRTDDGFKCADGEMTAVSEPFKIYDYMPGCISADFPSYYILEDGTIVNKL